MVMLAPAQLDMLDGVLPPLRSRSKQAFADAILAGKSGVEAVEASGSKARGHSAEVLASRWLNKVEIAQHLEIRRRLAVETANINAAQVIREIARLAFSSWLDEFPRFRVGDKISALDKLGRYLGLWSGDTNINATAIAQAGAIAEPEPRSDLDTARRIAFLLAQAADGNQVESTGCTENPPENDAELPSHFNGADPP